MLLVNKYNGFVTVSEPYIEDSFVQDNFAILETASIIDSATREKFDIYIKNSSICHIINQLTKHNILSKSDLHIIDGGVYMGIFSIVVDLICKNLSIKTKINSFEISKLLIDSIAKNFLLYNTNAELTECGFGEHDGDTILHFKKKGMIGASIVEKKGVDESDLIQFPAKIQKLSNHLRDEGVSLVKLDLEGNEVPAFRSIINDNIPLKDVFIIEFSPWQAKQKINDMSFGEFLLQNYRIYNIYNWLSKLPNDHQFERLSSFESLIQCVDGSKKSYNADLLLVPLRYADAFI